MEKTAIGIRNNIGEGNLSFGNCAGDLDGQMGRDCEIDGGGVIAKEMIRIRCPTFFAVQLWIAETRGDSDGSLKLKSQWFEDEFTEKSYALHTDAGDLIEGCYEVWIIARYGELGEAEVGGEESVVFLIRHFDSSS